MGGIEHSRYEGADGAERMRSVEAFDNQVRGHPAFGLSWPNVMQKTVGPQTKAMELNSQIVKLVTEQEHQNAKAEDRAPQFWSDPARASIKPRSTTDALYLCAEAVARAGLVVHYKACIDRTSHGTCFNTNTVIGALQHNSVLRVFVETKQMVMMPKKTPK